MGNKITKLMIKRGFPASGERLCSDVVVLSEPK